MTDFSVDKIASLASLRFSDSEAKAFESQMAEILKTVDQLQRVPMTAADAKEMGAFHVLTALMKEANVDPSYSLRGDEDHGALDALTLTNDEALKSAPKTGGIPGELLFEVPAIIERRD